MLVGLIIYKKLLFDLLVAAVVSVDLIKYFWGYLIILKKNGPGLHNFSIIQIFYFQENLQVFHLLEPKS